MHWNVWVSTHYLYEFHLYINSHIAFLQLKWGGFDQFLNSNYYVFSQEDCAETKLLTEPPIYFFMS